MKYFKKIMQKEMADRPGSFSYWLIDAVEQNRAGSQSQLAQTRIQDFVQVSEQRYISSKI